MRNQLNEKEKGDIIIFIMLLIAYFLGAVVSSLLLRLNDGDLDAARYASLGLLIMVGLKLVASKAYVVLECEKSSCFGKSFPTTQFIYDNSKLKYSKSCHFCRNDVSHSHFNFRTGHTMNTVPRDEEEGHGDELDHGHHGSLRASVSNIDIVESKSDTIDHIRIPARATIQDGD